MFVCAESAASALQKRLLVGLNKEMSTPGKDKKEFPAGSGRYIKADQLAELKANAADKSPVILALDIILTFIGSREKALNIFDGSGLGLCVALGEDFVADITGKSISNFHIAHMFRLFGFICPL